MEVHKDVGLLVFGTLFGLIVGIPCNLWASTYIEIVVNGRTELWGLMIFWTLGIFAVGVVLFGYGVMLVRRGRNVQDKLVSLKNQVEDMKKQIEDKIEKLHESYARD